MNNTFEYHVVHTYGAMDGIELTKLGNEGWELVGFIASPTSNGYYIYTFKRQSFIWFTWTGGSGITITNNDNNDSIITSKQ